MDEFSCLLRAQKINLTHLLFFFHPVYLGLERNDLGGTIPDELTTLFQLGMSLKFACSFAVEHSKKCHADFVYDFLFLCS